MTLFLLIVFGLYFIFLMALLFGWERTLEQPIQESVIFYSIAIIVPFRNEAENLEGLIHSLKALNYPKDKLEIILVNDHSTDQSVDRIREFNFPGIKIIDLVSGESGKKKAITKGVEMATSEIIVTTDADCLHHSNWLKSFNSFFNYEHVQMVVGAVAIQPTQSFFATLQAIEFSSLIGSGAALLQWKIPAMANGANLAFRKQTFIDAAGYLGNEHIPSGDDEYLLRKIFNAYQDSVVFNNQSNAVVNTLPQKDVSLFFQQRLRWAGKWKLQNNVMVKLVGLAVFLFQIFFILTLLMAMYKQQPAAILLLAKVGLEGIFLWRVCQFLNVKFTLVPFVLLQIIYPFYVVLTAVGSLFLPFQWKGRKS